MPSDHTKINLPNPPTPDYPSHYYQPPWRPMPYYPYVKPTPSVCPGCGRCNTCGHGGPYKPPPNTFYYGVSKPVAAPTITC